MDSVVARSSEMNLHNLHNEPKSLDHHDDRDYLPSVAWEKYKNNHEELKKREKMWARDPQTAYWYAYNILKGQFELGEKAIAKDARYSYWYAANVLKKRFKLGEPAIKKTSMDWIAYARMFSIK